MSQEQFTCVHKVWGGWEYHRCGKKADSTGLCGRHKPEAIAKRKASTEKRQKEKYDALKQEWQEKRQRERNAAMFPELLALAERVLRSIDDDFLDISFEWESDLRAAIQKARGE